MSHSKTCLALREGNVGLLVLDHSHRGLAAELVVLVSVEELHSGVLLGQRAVPRRADLVLLGAEVVLGVQRGSLDLGNFVVHGRNDVLERLQRPAAGHSSERSATRQGSRGRCTRQRPPRPRRGVGECRAAEAGTMCEGAMRECYRTHAAVGRSWWGVGGLGATGSQGTASESVRGSQL
jgi:hypothetical protein